MREADAPSDSGARPCSPAEETFWSIARLHPEHQPHFVRRIDFRGELDRAAMTRALREIVNRNDALRTTFQTRRIRAPGSSGLKRQLVRSVQPSVRWQLEEIMLTSRSDAERSDELAQALRQQRAHAFDPRTGPLFGFTLVQTGGDMHTLLITVSHLIVDAWSVGILMRDLRRYYNHFRTSDESPAWPDRPQASEYVAWYWQTVQRDGYLARSLNYWAAQLESSEQGNRDLPRDRSPSRVEHLSFVPHVVEGSVASTDALFEFNRRHGFARVTVPLAAYVLMLARVSASNRFHIANVVHGRFNSRLEQIVGLLSNMIVTQIVLDPGQDLLAWLGRLQVRYMASLRHGVVAVTTVMEHLTRLGKMPADYLLDPSVPKLLFNMFGVDGAGRARDVEFDGVHATRVASANAGPTLYELSLHVWWDGELMRYRVGGWADLYDRSTIERMAQAYRDVVEAIVAAAPQPVAAVLRSAYDVSEPS